MFMETPYKNTPYKNNLRKRTKIFVRIENFNWFFPPYKNIQRVLKMSADFCLVDFLRINSATLEVERGWIF